MEIQAGVRRCRAVRCRRFQRASRSKARAVFGGRATRDPSPIAIVFTNDHVRHFYGARLRAVALVAGRSVLLPKNFSLSFTRTDLPIWDAFQTIGVAVFWRTKMCFEMIPIQG